MVKPGPVSLFSCYLLIHNVELLAMSPASHVSAFLNVSHHDNNELTSETVRQPPKLNIFFLGAAVVMVPLHRKKALTKTLPF